MHVFEFPLTVGPELIDVNRHVNNVAFVKVVQDAAVAHWRAVAPADMQAAVGWVVRRHEIEYLRPAFEGDVLTVRTWVGEPSAATWERFTEIRRPSDDRTVVTARTVWVLVDAATGRPRRIDTAMAALIPPQAG